LTNSNRVEGSRAVQGCLFGAVALFVILLVVMLFLAYQRFREQTSTPRPTVESVYPEAVLQASSAVSAPGAARFSGRLSSATPAPRSRATTT